VDPEQIRSEMSATRASIDRKLDVLTTRTTIAGRQALKQVLAAAIVTIAAALGARWWRRGMRA
jgi:hypothetical protein